ncbi:hypothetical protein [Pseudomonas sp.]|jgi:hypothetical protein|uniref:hypothetical protein n=1 Tax=Pseudomonas sp. TaxID=306 RepID=UPI002ED771AF
MSEISASDHMNSLLATKSLVIYTGTITTDVIVYQDVPLLGKIPVVTKVTTRHDSSGFSKVVNSKVIEVLDLKFDQANITSLPQTGLLTRKTVQNCADASVTSSIGLSVTGTQTWGVTKTNGVTTTIGASVNASVGVQGVGSAGMTLTFSQAISTTTAMSEGGSQQVSRTSNENITIGPRRSVLIELFAYQSTAEIPFSGKIVIDGNLENNLSGVTQASDLLSLSERTLPFSGILRLSDVSQANLRTSDLGGVQGCAVPNSISIAEERFPPFPADKLGSYLLDRFKAPVDFARSESGEIHDHIGKFSNFTWLGENEGPTIGPSDGTSYEILYTTEIYEPSAACGFNDLGVMNTGIFSLEARQYRNYSNGQLVSQWQDTVKNFLRCHEV